ncbi:MAG: nucleotidyltransferase family protein [bacterium]|nr:nucleotidyltransferase family protein [bacterium]
MQAIILAEGIGTRLIPLTLTTPKPLIVVGDFPILEHQIRFLSSYNITDIYISIYHLKDEIKNYFENGTKWGVNIQYYEPEQLMGTAGAVKKLENKITGDFLVLYCDYLHNINLNNMITYHNKATEGTVATIMVKKYYVPLECDHLHINKENYIQNVINRPLPVGKIIKNRSNIGIYLCKKEICNYIQDKAQSFEKDVFPNVLKNKKKLYSYYTDEYIIDMGSHERLLKVQSDFRSGKHRLRDSDKSIPEYVIT